MAGSKKMGTLSARGNSVPISVGENPRFCLCQNQFSWQVQHCLMNTKEGGPMTKRGVPSEVAFVETRCLASHHHLAVASTISVSYTHLTLPTKA